MKKILSLFLLVFLLFTLCACGDPDEEGIPEGMKIASCDGATYRLYVPTVWNLDLSNGVSGAYYNLSTQSTVHAQLYGKSLAPTVLSSDGEDISLKAFWNAEISPTYAMMSGLSSLIVNFTDSILDEENALKVDFTLPIGGADMAVTQYLCYHPEEESILVLSFERETKIVETIAEDVKRIVEEFIFCPAYVAPDYGKQLARTAKNGGINGMILASVNNAPYDFFIPFEWEIEKNTAFSCGYVPQDMTNVSVISYVSDTHYEKADDYFAEIEKELVKMVSDYQRLSQREVTVGDKKGYSYTYSYKLSGKTYQIEQVLVAKGTDVYSITYTALQENFAKHYADFEKILSYMEWN